MIAIIDYKAGNLTSVKLAFDALGAESRITSDPAAIVAAERVVFPGVGAAASAMRNLRELGLEETVRQCAAQKPFLGICLGMQILFDHTEEDGGVDTLGIISGQVRRFRDLPGFKVLEIGWNQVDFTDGENLGGSPLRAEYYFVHSYYAEICPWTAGTTEYAGVNFTAMVKKDRLWACQFHPEKSGRTGLALLDDWLKS
ncbi:MAG: imidazole glycerol phosphate synthase subunit HisH [Kiritimatiellae bacterium]|nr:imidazole glycerol phosphate synthase subunit HisH [Kiritimatiellia bacterium]